MRAEVGTVLGQRYRLTSPVAAGGMGEVWRAQDDVLGRTVAVKVLRSELVDDAGFLGRFRTEARNSALLTHPGIATTYDYGESDGSAWIVMELVPGEPLSDLLAREGALEPRRAMRLLARAADGLAAAHAAGLVHRDVKPGNLLVTPDGSIKVTDFGIARAMAEAPVTATGQVMGTAAYLSPEQATGRRDLTPAADVYALGVVAYEVLAGHRPFTGESQVAIALAQVNDPPPPLPDDVPASARALVTACLAKDAGARPRDAGVVSRVATRIADGDDAGALSLLAAAGGAAAAAPTVAAPALADPTAVQAVGTGPTRALGAPEVPATRRQARANAAAAAAGAGAVGLAGAGAAAAEEHGGVPWDPDGSAPRTDGVVGAGPGGRGGVGADSRPRRRMTVPLLGLLAVLAVVAAAIAFSQDGGGSDPTPEPAVTAPSATPRQQTPSRPTATQEETEEQPSATRSASPTSSASSTSASPTATASSPATPSAAPSSSAPAPTSSAPSPTAPAATAPTDTPAARAVPPPVSAAAGTVGGQQHEEDRHP